MYDTFRIVSVSYNSAIHLELCLCHIILVIKTMSLIIEKTNNVTNLITSGSYYNDIILSKTVFPQAPPYVLLPSNYPNPIPKPIPKSHRDTHYPALTLTLTHSNLKLNLPYSEPEPLS
jgi:hypothetical protein